VVQVVLATVPLLIVLLYFLYLAWKRPTLPIYNLGSNYTEDQWQQALQETGSTIRLMDIVYVYLGILVTWTTFGTYLASFIPKRRHLIGRYLREGATTVGDVIYDELTRHPLWSRICFCCWGKFHDYGYAVYPHPDDARRMIRKRVRVYQRYTREKIAIVLLPGRPLSGQAKVDLEIDLLAASKDRDQVNTAIVHVAMVWILFVLLAPLYVISQMAKVPDDQEDEALARRIFMTVVGLCLPFAYLVNWIRFLMYRNWMTNRAAVTEDSEEARVGYGCLMTKPSEDGTDVIPYSIMNEDDASFLGVLPDHLQNSNSNDNSTKKESPILSNPPWTTV
jgi:hypothetical protein